MEKYIKLPDFSFWTKYDPKNLTLILSAFFIGIIIASVATIYRQQVLGGIVRKILEKKALSPKTALSVEDLGYKKNNIFVKVALRKNSTFRKIVHAVEVEKETTLYYIPEENSAREEMRFRKKGNSAVWVLVGIVIFLVAAFAALTLVPYFSDELKNILS